MSKPVVVDVKLSLGLQYVCVCAPAEFPVSAHRESEAVTVHRK